MSFDDKESFKEAVESLRFNSGDPNTHLQIGSNGMPLEDSERDDDNITSSDLITFRRVRSSSSLSNQDTRMSGDSDIQVCFNNPPANPEFDNGM